MTAGSAENATFIAARNAVANSCQITRAAARAILVDFADEQVAAIGAASAAGGVEESQQKVVGLVEQFRQELRDAAIRATSVDGEGKEETESPKEPEPGEETESPKEPDDAEPDNAPE